MDKDFRKITDGVWLTGSTPVVLVESEQKLAALAGSQPGTIAYTADLHMWMLDTDGTTWVPWFSSEG